MSATTHIYNPETIANLEAAIQKKIERGQTLATQLFYTHLQRLGGRPAAMPAWHIRRQLEALQDELELDLAELDRRRI